MALEIGVAVWRGTGFECGPTRIALPQFELQRRARRAPLAGHAAHGVDAPVQVDGAAATGRLMQAIDVLCEQQAHAARRLQPRQRVMRRTRTGAGHRRPADQAARQ